MSEGPAKLSASNFLLVIKRDGCDEVTVPLAELGVIVVSHPQVVYTQSVLSGLAQAGGTFITCDEKHVPVGILLPIAAHFAQTERFRKQAEAPEPTRKRLWQQIIKAKIKAQGQLLMDLRKNDYGLIELSKTVKSGDTDNVEAQASKRYWPRLFEDPDFSRERYGEDQNRFLNYGYAILRAIIARGICAAGLHPSLGLHHHNKYDSFCLASDLMEPFRPFVDRVVFDVVEEFGKNAPMDKEVRGRLLSAFLGRLVFEKEERTFFEIAERTASSLAQVFTDERKDLILPEI